MADRKQTPDILGEILGDDSVVAPTPPAAPARRPARQAHRDSPDAAGAAIGTGAAATDAPAELRWEYLVVSLQNDRGWRPRYANGEELADWRSLPIVHDYANELGSAGWELAAASAGHNLYGAADGLQLYFKRRVAADQA